jgi:hypothetical protein
MANFHQREFLRFLNECRGEENLDSFFFMGKDQTAPFLRNYYSETKYIKKFNFQSGVTQPEAKIQYYHTTNICNFTQRKNYCLG